MSQRNGRRHEPPPPKTAPAAAQTDGRSTIGVAMIARDAAETLPRCLASIRPWVDQLVVCVDERTIDKTARIAKKAGAEVYPIKVSDWHECAQHGRVLAQHFARARSESFRHLNPELTWWMWLDADDVFKGGERLAEILSKIPSDHLGLWLEYHYSTLNDAAVTNTLFHRERILRASVGWEWDFRVHEIVRPAHGTQGPWTTHPELRVYHQEGAHKSENSAQRNILLLEIDLEENPRDGRAMFYLGNQYFALGKWREAVEWYERSFDVDTNPYQRWQSAVYQSMAYERLGDLPHSFESAHQALDEVPYHPEPYYRLASLCLLAGQFEKVEFWTELGDQRAEAPFFAFKNPLDHSYNSRVVVADALAQQGKVTQAREVLEGAYRVVQDERVGHAIARYRAMEMAERQATGYVEMARLLGPEWAAEQAPKLPEQVRSFGRVRDVYTSALIRGRASSQPRVVFWCGRSYEPWAPPSINAGGIGGSETAVVKIAERFARDGWQVDVYNGPGHMEGEHDGVGYWEPERVSLRPGMGTTCDLLVSWRQPSIPALPLEARAAALWCHDLNYGPQPEGAFQRWGRILGVSAWHARMLQRYYDLADERVAVAPNGVDLDRFDPNVRKMPMQCVYASSADRGLPLLLSLWPRIAEGEPGARLKVAYGWQTMDGMIAAGRRDLAQFKTSLEAQLANTPGVEFLGRLGQADLGKLYSESVLWLYPTSFLEVSCISAMEAMAGGCVPVTSHCGALPETIGPGGAVIPGLAHSPPWSEFYVSAVRGLLVSPEARAHYLLPGLERAKELTWDVAYASYWKPMVAELLGIKTEVAV